MNLSLILPLAWSNTWGSLKTLQKSYLKNSVKLYMQHTRFYNMGPVNTF